jgi:hypothetical protein
MTKNEAFLLKEMLPIWQRYADAFIFMNDGSTDETNEFLMENKEKFNILSILNTNRNDNDLAIESDMRQKLFDEAFKYSGKIICMDSDEYLDGNLNKEQLNYILDTYKNTLFHLNWIQYVSNDEIRVDDKWKDHLADRIGSYTTNTNTKFKNIQMHSEHLPNPGNGARFTIPNLFVSHAQWLDKKYVATKQYFWKIVDYVNRTEFGIQTIDCREYDNSVNNFNWEIEKFDFPLKINSNIYQNQTLSNNYKHKFIKENIKKYNIPNLNDWGMGFHECHQEY